MPAPVPIEIQHGNLALLAAAAVAGGRERHLQRNQMLHERQRERDMQFLSAEAGRRAEGERAAMAADLQRELADIQSLQTSRLSNSARVSAPARGGAIRVPPPPSGPGTSSLASDKFSRPGRQTGFGGTLSDSTVFRPLSSQTAESIQQPYAGTIDPTVPSHSSLMNSSGQIEQYVSGPDGPQLVTDQSQLQPSIDPKSLPVQAQPKYALLQSMASGRGLAAQDMAGLEALVLDDSIDTKSFLSNVKAAIDRVPGQSGESMSQARLQAQGIDNEIRFLERDLVSERKNLTELGFTQGGDNSPSLTEAMPVPAERSRPGFRRILPGNQTAKWEERRQAALSHNARRSAGIQSSVRATEIENKIRDLRNQRRELSGLPVESPGSGRIGSVRGAVDTTQRDVTSDAQKLIDAFGSDNTRKQRAIELMRQGTPIDQAIQEVQ